MYEAGTREEYREDYHSEEEGIYRDEMDFMVASKALECDICNQRCRPSDFGNLCSCEHSFCKDCLKYYVLHKVRNEFVEIECPKEGCSDKINKQCYVFQELPNNLQVRYKRIQQNIKQLANPSSKICPECSENLLEVKNEPNLFCKKCVKKYCKMCMSPPHPVHLSCEKQVARFLKFNFQFKRCLRCMFIVEKSEGCNHMTCSCGFEFCYNCGEYWNHGMHQCPPKRPYVRRRSYHVVKREIPQRQVFALNVLNMSLNPEQLSGFKPKGRKTLESSRKIDKLERIKRLITQNTTNKENTLFIGNRSFTHNK